MLRRCALQIYILLTYLLIYLLNYYTAALRLQIRSRLRLSCYQTKHELVRSFNLSKQNVQSSGSRWYLGAEESVLVEISSQERAVFVRGDDALSLDADAARSTGDLTRHVHAAPISPRRSRQIHRLATCLYGHHSRLTFTFLRGKVATDLTGAGSFNSGFLRRSFRNLTVKN